VTIKALKNNIPDRPCIYHITHLDNLHSILEHDGLYSDAKKISLGLNNRNIGMSEIKRRRLILPVDCHPNTTVGQYVPFYFCPRSIMLFILHVGNHPDLTYHGGQGPILHLVSYLHDVVTFANSEHIRWAFTATNAGARYTQFYNDLSHLNELDWGAIEASYFRDPHTKEGKQAEFLMYDFFPWGLIHGIGVENTAVFDRVNEMLRTSAYQPRVTIKRDWYY